jgi:hypothetical protein
VLGACCALALGAGCFVKESAVWGAPLLLGLAAWDLAHRANARFWRAAGAVGAGSLIVALTAYWVTTGDPLYRLHGLEATHNVRPWSFHGRSQADLVARLTYEPLAAMLENPELGIPLALAAPAAVHAVFRLAFLPRGTRLWVGVFAVVLLSFWFGSTSLRSYNPLPVERRYLLPLLPPLAILAAISSTALVSGSARRGGERVAALAIAAVALAGVVVTWRPDHGVAMSYAACALASLAAAWRPAAAPSLFRGLLARRVLAVAMLTAAVLYYAPKERLGGVRPIVSKERAVVDHLLRDPASPTVVFTDRQSVFALPFFFASELPPHLRIVDWAEPGLTRGAESARKLVYVHIPRVTALALNWGEDRPRFVDSPPDWTLLHEEMRPNAAGPAIRMYEVSTVDDILAAK